MKPFLINHIVCLLDRGALAIRTFNQQPTNLTPDDIHNLKIKSLGEQDFDMEIINGLLINERQKVMYPVYRGVPRLLLFTHPLLERFKLEFADALAPYLNEGYSFPNAESIPGEKNVLASFSNEWTEYGYNEEVYWGQATAVYNESLYATLENDQQNLEHKLTLEVGIGSGGSANYMSKKINCSMIGVDLGYSVDVAYRNFGANPFLHIVQASAFNLPFRDNTFDFVYSHGVIHHTFNTRKAFGQLAKLPKPEGRLYVWVYSFLNEQRTLKRKMIMLMERLVRPWCAVLPGWLQTIVLTPIAPLYIFHQNTINNDKKTGMAKYRWREAMHAARDRFTPKFIHRHSEEEVVEWFSESGYKNIRPLSAKKLPDFVPVGFFKNTGVEGFKQ